jgi:hypothetical protein
LNQEKLAKQAVLPVENDEICVSGPIEAWNAFLIKELVYE